MNKLERKVADELDRFGIPFLDPDLGKKGNVCCFCGLAQTDFTVGTQIGMRSFHTECLLRHDNLAEDR